MDFLVIHKFVPWFHFALEEYIDEYDQNNGNMPTINRIQIGQLLAIKSMLQSIPKTYPQVDNTHNATVHQLDCIYGQIFYNNQHWNNILVFPVHEPWTGKLEVYQGHKL